MKKIIILFGVFYGTLQAQNSASVCFNAAKISNTINVGPDPKVSTSGDFNNDGNMDLAIGNTANNFIAVLFGNGAGSFGSPVNYPVNGPNYIINADFNGDGNLDLAVTNLNGASVLLGSNSGTFSSAMNYNPSALNSISLSSADFNTDGKADIVLVNNGSDNVSILLSNNTNTFSPAVNYNVGSDPVSVACTDFNGDGKTDLIVTNSNSYNISILYGLTGGTFSTAINYGVCLACDPLEIVADDYNTDGKPDLAILTDVNQVLILMGNGAGGVASNSTFTLSNGFFSSSDNGFISGDFNSDGKKDLMIGNRNYNISLLQGTGTGSFVPPIHMTVGQIFNRFASADFNNDGKPDLAASCYLGGAYIMLNPGTGIFYGVRNYPNELYSLGAVSADFNGDGNQDVATVHDAPNKILIYSGSSSGTLNLMASINNVPALYANAIVSSDFNSDGKADIAVSNAGTNNVSLNLGTGTGTFGTATYFNVGTSPMSLVSSDLNLDGKMDLAVANATSNSISVLLGTGTGSFSNATNFTAGTTPYFILSEDFNNDSKPDLVTANYNSNDISVFFNAGSGNFLPAVSYSVGMNPRHMVSSDFNGDGFKDIAIALFNGYKVKLLMGTASGSFTAGFTYTLNNIPLTLSKGDYNGDGKTDIALANFTNAFISKLSILLGSGTGTFSLGEEYRINNGAFSVLTGNMNSDIFPDLTVACYGFLSVFHGCNPLTVLVDKNESTIKDKLLIYPNPTNDFITIQSTSLTNNSLVQILNALGQVVLMSSFQERIDINCLPSGLYLVNIIKDGKSVISSKIVKKDE